MNDANDTLKDTRLQLHWLAQVPGAFGRALADPHSLWQHVALRRTEDGAWRSAPAKDSGLQAGLRLTDGALLLLRDAGIVEDLATAGLTLDEALARFHAALEAHGSDAELSLRDPEEMPDHAILRDQGIALPPEAARSLDTLYAKAWHLLGDMSARHDDAEPVLLWPHHFDVSVMRTIVPGTRDDAEDARTVTLGLSPGDDSYDEPYWYVTLWPAPEDADLPELPGAGRWHRAGWTGAVLVDSANTQGDAGIVEFLEVANEAGASLLKG